MSPTSNRGLPTFALSDVLLVVMTFAYWLAFSLLRPLVGPFATTLGASSTEVAVIIGSQSVVAFVVAIPVGTITDRFDARNVAGIGAIGMTAAALTLAASKGTLGLVVGQVILGLGAIFVWLSIQKLMTQGARHTDSAKDLDSQTRARRIANFTILIAVAQMFGPALGGVVSDAVSYPAAFTMVAALTAVAAASAFLVPSLPQPDKEASTAASAGPSAQAARTGQVAGSFRAAGSILRQQPAMRATFAAAFLSLYLTDFRISLLPVHLRGEGVPIATIGLLLSVAAAAGIASRPLLPYLLRRFGSGGTTLICLVPAAGLLFSTVFTDHVPLLFILVATHGLAMGLAQPMTLAFVSDVTAEDERGLGLGVRLMAHRMAQWVGPLVFGLVASASTIALAFGISTALAIPGGAAAAQRVSATMRQPTRGSSRRG